MNEASCAFQVIDETLKEDKTLSVSAMCEIAGVSRSGYYAWLKAASVREEREEQDRKDFELILREATPKAPNASSAHESARRHESEEDSPPDEEVSSGLSGSPGESVPANGEGSADKPCRLQSSGTGV